MAVDDQLSPRRAALGQNVPKLFCHVVGQRNDPFPGGRFGRFAPVIHFGRPDELTLDVQGFALKVDILHRNAAEFRDPQPRFGLFPIDCSKKATAALTSRAM